jgi:hypothetical protein
VVNVVNTASGCSIGGTRSSGGIGSGGDGDGSELGLPLNRKLPNLPTELWLLLLWFVQRRWWPAQIRR